MENGTVRRYRRRRVSSAVVDEGASQILRPRDHHRSRGRRRPRRGAESQREERAGAG